MKTNAFVATSKRTCERTTVTALIDRVIVCRKLATTAFEAPNLAGPASSHLKIRDRIGAKGSGGADGTASVGTCDRTTAAALIEEIV